MTTYAVVNPATGKTEASYPVVSDAEVQQAIADAQSAYEGWGHSSTVAERTALIARVAELHTERREQLADIIVREMGKPREQALGEVDFSAAIYQFYADRAEELLADEPISLVDAEGDAFVRRSAMGVLLGIMPWNFPYYQVSRFAGPNLLIGNTILLKHAGQCPESALAMQQ
ncbi:MAG: aldehyde dehydrogenase family protein, partial [Agromyces sp.]